MYSAQVIDHFEHPRHSGELPQADCVVTVENPACGDIMRLALLLRDGCIEQAAFKAKGCVASIACGSALMEMLQGISLEQAHQIQREHILQALGGLALESQHASHLAFDALQAALKEASGG